jgi:8-oxo-dGTP pyrophosphatase MutT (NUDIX family)
LTRIEVGVVDVAVIRRVGKSWRVLTLERSGVGRSPGSWEIVHGKIDRRERPDAAALREVREETGLEVAALYSITTNPFYLPKQNRVQVAVAFAAVVKSATVELSEEHRRSKWATFSAASKYLSWPRSHEMLRQIAWILRSGDGGAVEDVLRVKGVAGRE